LHPQFFILYSHGMFVIATAGHVDHGKSTLVRALTGINPDRLREEQQREMTIDLGFAWMTLPPADDRSPTPDGGQAPVVVHRPASVVDTVGIIDVPGHIDFIDNMLAGVGGIDAALLVIAADEGPMPQTREHIAILQLLRVQRGVVALTKSDLVDAEWLALMRSDIAQALAHTPLAQAPVVPVSARAGTGLDALCNTLANVLQSTPPRKNIGKPRLPVDRAFSVQGFGTVVTGTLVDGDFAIGDDVDVLTPKGDVWAARIRGLQTHKQKLERANAGSRVAINLTGVDVAQAVRGSVVAKPGTLRPSTLLDVGLELLNDAPLLRHNAEVKVFNGAAQSMARVWLLESDALKPGQSGWAQLILTTPMAVANGDRFIVRQPSPSQTVGGGVVVDAHAVGRYRRRGGGVADANVLARLEALSQGTPVERLTNALRELKFATPAQAQAKAQLSAPELEQAVRKLSESQTVLLAHDVLALVDGWQAAAHAAATSLAAFHKAQPLQAGMPRDTLRSQLKLDAKIFNALLSLQPPISNLHDDGETVRLSSHRVQLSPGQQQAADAVLAQCAAQPWNTPSVKECKAALGDAVYDVLLRQRKLVQCGPEVVLLPTTYDGAIQKIRELVQRDGQITAAQVRDVFNTTRKYALGLLEHLDAIGVTKRVGDARVLR
jgi:selenocysteine-specific elongation factor